LRKCADKGRDKVEAENVGWVRKASGKYCRLWRRLEKTAQGLLSLKQGHMLGE
jgi:hypothetical protein